MSLARQQPSFIGSYDPGMEYSSTLDLNIMSEFYVLCSKNPSSIRIDSPVLNRSDPNLKEELDALKGILSLCI